jgi:hypothetical protein
MTATLTKTSEVINGKTCTVYTIQVFNEDGTLHDVEQSLDLELILKRILGKYSKITVVVELSK